MSAPQRETGIDVARCVALLGIAYVHTHLTNPGAMGSASQVLYWLGNGVAPALFAVLIGVSIRLSWERRQASMRTFLAHEGVRSGLICAVGLFLGALGSPVAVILVNLAFLMLIGSIFARLSPGLAGAAALLLIPLGPLLTYGLRATLELNTTYQVFTMYSLGHPVQFFTELFITGYYPLFHWLGYFFLGLALSKLPRRSPRSQTLVFGGGLALATLGFVLSAYWAASTGVSQGSEWHTERLGLYGTPPLKWDWLLLAVPHGGTPVTGLVMGAGSACVIAGCLLLSRSRTRALRPALTFMARLGSVTLTAYTLHVLALSAVPLVGLYPDSFFAHLVAFAVLTLLLLRWQTWTLEALIARASHRALTPSRGSADSTNTSTLASGETHAG